MNTYLVTVIDPSVRESLLHLGQVGNPKYAKTLLIVKSDKTADEIKTVAGVVDVELDSKAAPGDQENPDSWWLGWVSNSQNYKYTKTGKGVDIYVVDSGVRLTHIEFEGRAKTLWSFDDRDYDLNGDSPSHGTTCASCAAGKLHGTAKQANIWNVRTEYMRSNIVKGLEKVIEHHQTKPNDNPSVINFSIYGPGSFKLIMDAVVNAGIVVAACTGNDSKAKPANPALEPNVLGVGAVGVSNTNPRIESRTPIAVFSNRGADVYAPGVSGYAAIVDSDNKYSSNVSGTSFATPLTVGIMALMLEGSTKFHSARQVRDFMSYFKGRCETGRVFENLPHARFGKDKTPYDQQGPWLSIHSGMVESKEYNTEPYPKPVVEQPEPQPEPTPEPVPQPPPEVIPSPQPQKKKKGGGVVIVLAILAIVAVIAMNKGLI